MNQQTNPIGFLRTTAIGGLLFLLPLIVVGALIGQVVPIVMTIAESLGAQMKPVLARLDDCIRMGFETERDEEAGLISLYISSGFT